MTDAADTLVSVEATKYRQIGLASIAVLPNRMRALREEVVASLAASMKRQGLLQPIVLRPSPSGFYLVAGRHRQRRMASVGLARSRSATS